MRSILKSLCRMLVTATVITLNPALSINSEAATNISGVINIYTPVTSITNCSCPTLDCPQVTVNSSTGFAVGDKILIIQMKGARVDSSNTSSHGSVLNLYDAGSYEYATISNISGNIIY